MKPKYLRQSSAILDKRSNLNEISKDKIIAFTKIQNYPVLNETIFEKFGFKIKGSCKKKKTIYFDLDNTLIFRLIPGLDYSDRIIYSDCTKEAFIKENGILKSTSIIVRPFTSEILSGLYPYYEIICYTGATKAYAQEILRIIDPSKKYFSYILYRCHCLLLNGNLVKDIKLIRNRAKESSILIDNSISCFYNCMDNSIFIKPFEGDCKDLELKKLMQFLLEIKDAPDVRIPIKKEYKLSEEFNTFKLVKQGKPI